MNISTFPPYSDSTEPSSKAYIGSQVESGQLSIRNPQPLASPSKPQGGIVWHPNTYPHLKAEHAGQSQNRERPSIDPRTVTVQQLRAMRTNIMALMAQQIAWEREHDVRAEQEILEGRVSLYSNLNDFFNDHFVRLGETPMANVTSTAEASDVVHHFGSPLDGGSPSFRWEDIPWDDLDLPWMRN